MSSDEVDDLATERIFSRTDYVASRPTPREFKPWHRPRKQFVRREQWTKQALKLFDDRAAGDPVKYLGLPGVDLLDLRYLYEEVCVPLGRPLRFLGMNAEARHNDQAIVDLNTSLDEVMRLGAIDLQSDVIKDDFRSLGQPRSMAWQAARRLGPFDVVNLDLCDGIASDDPTAQPSLYEAIAALLPFQLRNPNRWVLLVTSRVGRDHFHEDSRRSLVDRFGANLVDCGAFADQCRELLGIAAVEQLDLEDCDPGVYLRVMIVALCKWFMALGQVGSANRVELASCQAYRVQRDAPCEDLVSLALVFEPVLARAVDALNPSAPVGIDECAEATRIASRAASLKDVDAIVEGDAALRDELVAETEVLLRAARYDVSSYQDWLVTAEGPRD